ncbi:MAG TPA: VOC family protein [Bryobacteraceae bacterium]|nr:VOC family protein [Bryobacteraceae bacterium]
MISNRWMLPALCAVTAWAQAPGQAGIAHVAFRVADLEKTRAFYNQLGLEQFFAMKQGERTTEAFLKINDHQFIELYPRTDASQPLGLMHVCYESNDLQALHAQMVKRGLAVSDVRKAGAGNLLLTMKDPAGNTIEYTQYMPGSRHYEDRGKHLGADRISTRLAGVTMVTSDAGALRKFYADKLGISAPELEIEPPGSDAHTGIQFPVADLNQAAAALARRELPVESGVSRVMVTDPDGIVVSFVKAP